MLKGFFHRDSIITGIVAVTGLEAIFSLLLWIGLAIANEPILAHVRWFGGAFIPVVLILRYYAKAKDYPTTTKSVIATFFVTFIAFMWFLLKYKYITL